MEMDNVHPPRSLALLTGEDIPTLGESRRARMFPIRVRKGDISNLDRLTTLQEQGRQGLLAGAMRGYIEWLIPQSESLSARLSTKFEGLRKEFQSKLVRTHGRHIETVTWLMVGFEFMLDYWLESHAIDALQRSILLNQAENVFLEHIQEEASDMHETKPSTMFLMALHELERASVIAFPDKGLKPACITQFIIGQREDDLIYLQATAVYNSVKRYYQQQGISFPLSATQLWKDMAEEGITSVDSDGQPTFQKRYGDKNHRSIAIHRDAYDMNEMDDAE